MFRREIKFSKYQGTGNDFILIDDRFGGAPEDDPNAIKQLCDRHFGIGSDGLILIQPSDEADFHMEFFNPDGSKSFCGNGSRCAVKFAVQLGIASSEKCSFTAIDGLHLAVSSDFDVKVKMHDVSEVSERGSDYFIFTGSPHHLIFAQQLPVEDLKEIARPIRYSEMYTPTGVNVNYIAPCTDGIEMRTYERGVEDETLSCGTGVTAAAIGSALKFNLKSPINVSTKGGALKVHFMKTGTEFTDIWLQGSAVEVFRGTYII